MGKLLYPPVKIVRQNSNHIFRVLMESRRMIQFLENNYATPMNSKKEWCYFDITLKNDKKTLLASTNPDYLEVVYGEDNPYFKRKAHVISRYNISLHYEQQDDVEEKGKIMNRTIDSNKVFVGQAVQVFDAEEFTTRRGTKAALRRFILENTVDGYTQSALFEMYRENQFVDFVTDGFKIGEGDWVKVEYSMKVNSFQDREGKWIYSNTNKVYRYKFVTESLTKGFGEENENPFNETIQASFDDAFMKEDHLKRKKDNEG